MEIKKEYRRMLSDHMDKISLYEDVNKYSSSMKVAALAPIVWDLIGKTWPEHKKLADERILEIAESPAFNKAVSSELRKYIHV